MEFVRKRLELGREKYGHGVRTGDNPRTWGTDKDSWLEMAEEEFADAIVYVIADYIRHHEGPSTTAVDDNDRILELGNDPSLIKSESHRSKVQTLLNLIS
ncbi:hypothetical protein DSLPV1_165 [Dishui lake phycodnavirus 1]|uniref:hypothetical protein n=1 Tax=Dishui lake phycodnavirus 1 TaxID=2079134 RepID=UPI000CD699D7|nr:hypothetical protein C5Y57_gp165 [Dishui lake phycodnavirus 1]AUT19136.1 hypothetical protein DSLPV1_165 [Dishui lake phycodnavirus 1]